MSIGIEKLSGIESAEKQIYICDSEWATCVVASRARVCSCTFRTDNQV